MNRRWMVVAMVLGLLLVACGGNSGPTAGSWDNSKWDGAVWQ